MRASSHLLRFIPSSISTNSLQNTSICPSCLHLLSTIPRKGAPSSQFRPHFRRRHASNSAWIEGARRRIWGTKEGEAPPGAEDPYGGESILEKRRRIRREVEGGTASSQPEGNPLLERRRREREDLGLEIVEDRAKWNGKSDVVRAETKAEHEDVEYRPALTWDGLEHVGFTGEWWEMPVMDEETVVSYMTRPKLTKREDLLCAIHRAVVEVSTLQAAKMKLTYSSRPDMPDSTEMADLIRQVEIKIMKGEKSEMRVELAYPNSEAKSLVLEGMKAVEEADPNLKGLSEAFKDSPETKDQVEALEQNMYPADEQAKGQEARGSANAMPDEAAILDEFRRSVEEESPGSSPVALAKTTSLRPNRPLDESFLTLPLTDPKVKFAILKRVTQVSSNLIPDHALPRITTLSLLLDQLLAVSAPKSKSVHEVLTSSLSSSSHSQPATPLPTTPRLPNPNTKLLKGMKVPPLAHLPNVKIHAKRQTSIDRHKEVGRWKIIEAELRKKGLPVTGHRADGHVVGMRFGNGRRGMEY